MKQIPVEDLKIFFSKIEKTPRGKLKTSPEWKFLKNYLLNKDENQTGIDLRVLKYLIEDQQNVSANIRSFEDLNSEVISLKLDIIEIKKALLSLGRPLY